MFSFFLIMKYKILSSAGDHPKHRIIAVLAAKIKYILKFYACTFLGCMQIDPFKTEHFLICINHYKVYGLNSI